MSGPRTVTGCKVVSIHGDVLLDDVLAIEAEIDRTWADLIAEWQYPFDWHDRTTFPSEDQRNALAEAWYRREPSCPVEEWRELIDNEIGDHEKDPT